LQLNVRNRAIALDAEKIKIHKLRAQIFIKGMQCQAKPSIAELAAHIYARSKFDAGIRGGTDRFILRLQKS